MKSTKQQINKPIFISGIGTGIGKTVVSAIITKALNGLYWKPVQAGTDTETDSEWVKRMLKNEQQALPEFYLLKMAASPHIAMRKENMAIQLDEIVEQYKFYAKTTNKPIIIEGAGGLYAPLNQAYFSIDLAKKLNARLILVSQNYLGSINHSLMSARVCKEKKLDVIGWVFNNKYLHYEEEIADWSGYPIIGKIPFSQKITTTFIRTQAAGLKEKLDKLL